MSLSEIYESCEVDFQKLLTSCETLKKIDKTDYSLQKIEPTLDENGFVDCKNIEKTDFRSFVLNHIFNIREDKYFKTFKNFFPKINRFTNILEE